MSSDNYNIRWNGFVSSTIDMFKALFEDTKIADVTLVTEDEKQVRAHKVALSSSSPYFRNIFEKNPQANPIIILSGIQHSDLMAILKYLYTGEVDLHHEDLENFLNAGNKFKVKGLNEDNEKEATDNTLRNQKDVRGDENTIYDPMDKKSVLEELSDMEKVETKIPEYPVNHQVKSESLQARYITIDESVSNMEDPSSQVQTNPDYFPFTMSGVPGIGSCFIKTPTTHIYKPNDIDRNFYHQKNKSKYDQEKTQKFQTRKDQISIDISETNKTSNKVDIKNLFENPVLPMPIKPFGFMCENCKEMFQTVAMLTRHRILDHKAAVSYCCNICDFTSNNKNQLIIHKAMKHTNKLG